MERNEKPKETIYEDLRMLVQTNEVGEIFVHNKLNENVKARISPHGEGLAVTAHDGRLVPWSVDGLPAFIVRA